MNNVSVRQRVLAINARNAQATQLSPSPTQRSPPVRRLTTSWMRHPNASSNTPPANSGAPSTNGNLPPPSINTTEDLNVANQSGQMASNSMPPAATNPAQLQEHEGVPESSENSRPTTQDIEEYPQQTNETQETQPSRSIDLVIMTVLEDTGHSQQDSSRVPNIPTQLLSFLDNLPSLIRDIPHGVLVKLKHKLKDLLASFSSGSITYLTIITVRFLRYA
ncbi:hypothetical protein H072_242 [Dactylellina haptotyla CBS 200.50]|uniref:Uncharacterized protein n=1 Tax=Dactylellina haptotyla (strain CBS 200.50) TaxID=1284197 RepID=S8CE20_DACHA|nr:hypothetical protein H072_242 [Dactylellina haptotyla CBS 200.50]